MLKIIDGLFGYLVREKGEIRKKYINYVKRKIG